MTKVAASKPRVKPMDKKVVTMLNLRLVLYKNKLSQKKIASPLATILMTTYIGTLCLFSHFALFSGHHIGANPYDRHTLVS